MSQELGKKVIGSVGYNPKNIYHLSIGEITPPTKIPMEPKTNKVWKMLFHLLIVLGYIGVIF